MNTNTTPSLRQIIAEIKQYLSLQYEWIKLDGVEKLTRIVSALVLLTVSIILISITLLYLSLAGIIAAYSIISGAFFLLFVLLWLLRRPCVVNPILRFLYKIFITPKEDQNELTQNKNNEL